MSKSRLVARYLPLALLAWGLVFGGFFLGFAVSELRWFPRDAIADAGEAARIAWIKLFRPNRLRALVRPSDVAPMDVSKHRIVVRHPVHDGAAFLLTGGPGRFLEYCPEHGCAAAIFRRDGSLVHAYPYRPDELTTKRTLDLPYDQILHDDARDTVPFGLAPLPNGDLVVVYDFVNTKPYGGGIARMAKDGRLLWYRRDYSDHWPAVTPQNEILVISHAIVPGRVSVPFHKGRTETLDCTSGMLRDVIRVLDLDGNVKEEIPVFDVLLASRFRTRLFFGKLQVSQPGECDPIHTNSVVPVGSALAAKFNDVEPDDFLLSLRNLHAVAIIGRKSHTVKHLFSGSFIYQHSAQVTPEGQILLFDNFGTSLDRGPSRVLLYDPTTNQERTIFPNSKTPEDLNVFSRIAGNIDVSSDGTRALFTFSLEGKSFETRLDDGEILTTFDNLHDVSSLPQFANAASKVRYFTQLGVYYISPDLLNFGQVFDEPANTTHVQISKVREPRP